MCRENENTHCVEVCGGDHGYMDLSIATVRQADCLEAGIAVSVDQNHPKRNPIKLHLHTLYMGHVNQHTREDHTLPSHI